MYKLVIFAVLALAAVSVHGVGEPKEGDVNSPELHDLLKKVMATQNSDETLSKVTKVTTQVVAGIKYVVDFDVANPKNGESRKCSSTFVVQAWISKEPQTLSYTCSRAEVFLKEVSSSQKEFEDKMIQASVDRINDMTNNLFASKLIKVLNIKRQVFPPLGMIFRFDFQVEDTVCRKTVKDLSNCAFSSNNHVRTCHTRIMSRFMVGKKTIQITDAYCDRE